MIAKIKKANPIEDVIKEAGVDLVPKGTRLVGICPFHLDHRPSLSVDPHHQSYKCFPCGAGGDVFTFVMQTESVSFPEAARILAARAQLDYADGVEGTKISELYAAAELATQHFVSRLPTKVRTYLHSRGIDDRSIERFRLGYDDGTFRHPLEEAIGLISNKWRVLHRRIVFPIIDSRGRPIGFGGRKGNVETGAKYVNTCETAIFSKRKTIYGRPKRGSTVVVVEGYLDVIRCHQEGFENVTATLGTALTREHLLALQRIAPKVVLMFDGDAAGRSATDRAIELYLQHDVNLFIASLPSGDPCDFFDQRSDFESVVESAVDPLQYALNRVSVDASPTEAVDAVTFLSRIASNVNNSVRVSKTVEAMAKRLNIPVELVRQSIRHPGRSVAAKPTVDPIDLELLTIAINCPHLKINISSSNAMIQSIFDKSIVVGTTDFDILSPLLTPEECSLVSGLLGGDDWDERYKATMKTYLRRETDKEFEAENRNVSGLAKQYVELHKAQ